MLEVIVSNIRLRTMPCTIRFECESAKCEHTWEFHWWDMGDAYCRRCGSLATADNDPRVDRSDGHVRYDVGGEWRHATTCKGCKAVKEATSILKKSSEPVESRLPELKPGMFGRPTGRAIIQRNGSDVVVIFRSEDGVVRELGLGPCADLLCKTWQHEDELEVICQFR